MAAYFNLTLDTLAPADVTLSINSGAAATSSATVSLAIATSDGDTTGYSMRIYGDVDDSAAPSEYRAAQGDAPWISYATTKSVDLSATDGSKTVNVQVRDDVGNISTAGSDSITLDTDVPTVTILTGPTATKVSKVATFDTSTFTFEVDVAVQAWTVRVVGSTGAAYNTGTEIPSTAGSTGTSGTTLGATTSQEVVIKGADLETASAGDGTKIVKVFAQATAGAENWSV